MINLNLGETKDLIVRNNFQVIQDEIRRAPLVSGQWKFFELTIEASLNHERIRHYMGFKPLDVILTRVEGAGSPKFHYENFDATFLEISTTAACKLRFFAGHYQEEYGG